MAKKKISNITRFERTIGETTVVYKGIMDAELDVDEGDFLPNHDEGALYPVGIDNVGTPGRFPVTGTVTMEAIQSFIALLAVAAGSLKIIGKGGAGGGNQLHTVANQVFTGGSVSFSRAKDATASLQLIGYSADGSAHPWSEADSADTTAPTTAKTKTNNIVSFAHDALPTEGVLSVTFNVVRGAFLPNFTEGHLYPIGFDNVGVSDGNFPVTGQIVMESMDAANFVGEGVDDLVVTVKSAGGASNLVFTAANTQFTKSKSKLLRRADGSVALDFICYSTDGSTLPLSQA